MYALRTNIRINFLRYKMSRGKMNSDQMSRAKAMVRHLERSLYQEKHPEPIVESVKYSDKRDSTWVTEDIPGA